MLPLSRWQGCHFSWRLPWQPVFYPEIGPDLPAEGILPAFSRSILMDQDNQVQDEAPKLRTEVSEPASSPEVGQEPAIFEVRSDAGSQTADAEGEGRTEQKEPQGP